NIYDNSEKLQQAIPLKEVLTEKEYEHSKFEILQALTQLSGFIPGLDNYINSAAKREIIVYNKKFTSFLMQIIPAIRLLDIDVLLPKSLQELTRPKVSVKVKSNPGKSFIRLDKLLDFDWRIALGDHLLTKEDFDVLLKKSDGLLKYKSQFIYVDKEELEKIYKHFSANKKLS